MKSISFNNKNILAMKKKKTLLALAVVMVVAGSIFTAYSIRENSVNYMIEKNLEAIVDDEGGSLSFCYVDYNFHLIHRVLRCEDCEYVWGKGDNYGGICF